MFDVRCERARLARFGFGERTRLVRKFSGASSRNDLLFSPAKHANRREFCGASVSEAKNR